MRMLNVVVLISSLVGVAYGEGPAAYCDFGSSGGYVVKSTLTGRQVGAGYYFQKHDCQWAAASANSRWDVVCAFDSKGTAVYQLSTGTKFPGDWDVYSTQECYHALTHISYDGLACLPRTGGWGVYNLTRGFYYGGSFTQLNDCLYSVGYASPKYVCAYDQKGFAVYNKFTGKVAVNYDWFQIADCVKSIP